MRSLAGNTAVFVILLACLFQLQGCDAGDQDESERDKELIKEKIKVEGAADLVWKYKSAHDKCVRDKQTISVDLDACRAETASKAAQWEKQKGELEQQNAALKSENDGLKEKLQAVQAELARTKDRVQALETAQTQDRASTTGAMSTLTQTKDELQKIKAELLTCKNELVECKEDEEDAEDRFKKTKGLKDACAKREQELQGEMGNIANLNQKLATAKKETENAQQTVNQVAEKERLANERKMKRQADAAKKKELGVGAPADTAELDEELSAAKEKVAAKDAAAAAAATATPAGSTDATPPVATPDTSATSPAANALIETEDARDSPTDRSSSSQDPTEDFAEAAAAPARNPNQDLAGAQDAEEAGLQISSAAELQELQREVSFVEENDEDTRMAAERLRLLGQSHHAITQALEATQDAVLLLNGINSAVYRKRPGVDELAYEVDSTGDTMPELLELPNHPAHLARRITPT